jgi:dTDP-4-dehydrorhamnose 3,5-epimerase-like enzyme
MDSKIIKFKSFGDNRGALVSLEQHKNIPFNIKRVYYIYGTRTNTTRGKHAHTNLKQIVICVSGKCKFLLDDGKKKKIVKLNNPDKGLYIGKNIWREMYDFSHDCVLVVLANKYYNENEYIRDYKEFLKKIN